LPIELVLIRCEPLASATEAEAIAAIAVSVISLMSAP